MDKEQKHLYNLASRCYGVSEYTMEVYEKMAKIDLGSLTLMDLYSNDEKNLKMRKDLSLIERRYKIEKLIKRYKNE